MATKKTQAAQKQTATPKRQATTTKRQASTRERRPSEQVLQVVDRAVGAVPVVADAVRGAVEEWGDGGRLNVELDRAEARGADVRRQVTDQVVERARKARERVEPVYRPRVEQVESVYRLRVEPLYKERVEPVVRERVEPVYRQRLEPAVRRVRERI
jgi:hypothetical protein